MIFSRAIQIVCVATNIYRLGFRTYSNYASQVKAFPFKFYLMNRSRSLIECRGLDSKTLLQGLITNDMGFLEKHAHEAPNQPSSSLAMPHSCSVIYSFFLNTNVRFQTSEFFINNMKFYIWMQTLLQGRVLYDAFFYNLSTKHTEEHGNYLIECDSRIADQLMKHIKFYKLRKRVYYCTCH